MDRSKPTAATRSGQYFRQPNKYSAFIPNPLPPNPPITLDDRLATALSQADQALGRLDAVADLLPNPDLFVRMYVRKEAVLSSQIEGTQASLDDVLEFEASERRSASSDVGEVVNYVRAMNEGLNKLDRLPLSTRLLREIHKTLMTNVRGGEKSPGEFRRSQNWIGPAGADLNQAIFVPPPPDVMTTAMGDLEQFIHGSSPPTPILLRAGLIHAQFETIHPFLDGNGRMGRLLITFYLCERGALKRPLLYLSAFFHQHRAEYYDRLQAVRDAGEWEAWLTFFLTAVETVAESAASKAHAILKLRDEHRELVQKSVRGPATGLRLLDFLYENPYMVGPTAAKLLKRSYPTVNALFARFATLGLVEEITGQERNRVFRYAPYVQLLQA